MDHNNPESDKVVVELIKFYETLFPKPSSFELPPGQKNTILYVDQQSEIFSQRYNMIITETDFSF